MEGSASGEGSPKKGIRFSEVNESAPTTPNVPPSSDFSGTGDSLKSDASDASLLSLTDIKSELDILISKVNAGESFDEKRLDYLIALQEEHPEHQNNLFEEQQAWVQQFEDYFAECLAKQRSYIPVDISTTPKEFLLSPANYDGFYTQDLVQRIYSKRCLWLCRMSEDEIQAIHFVDLFSKYDPSGQQLDVVETSAIFACLPTTFLYDSNGKKAEFRFNIIRNLKELFAQKEAGTLPESKLRNSAYMTANRKDVDEDLPEDGGYGPIMDIVSTRVKSVKIKGIPQDEIDGIAKPRRSFTEVCKRHSILSKHRHRPSMESNDEYDDEEDSDELDSDRDEDDDEDVVPYDENSNTPSSTEYRSKSMKVTAANTANNRSSLSNEARASITQTDYIAIRGNIRQQINKPRFPPIIQPRYAQVSEADNSMVIYKNEETREPLDVIDLNEVIYVTTLHVGGGSGTTKRGSIFSFGSSSSGSKDKGDNQDELPEGAVPASTSGTVIQGKRSSITINNSKQDKHRILLRDIHDNEYVFEANDQETILKWESKIKPLCAMEEYGDEEY